MKDCAFQYATGNGEIFEDTGLIARADAEELWRKHIPKFKEHVEEGRNPEMAIWIDMEGGEGYEADEDEAEKLEEKEHELFESTAPFEKCYYKDRWEFVTACFTEQGCKVYIARNGHNLREPRIYAESSYRNEEWRTVRKALMNSHIEASNE